MKKSGLKNRLAFVSRAKNGELLRPELGIFGRSQILKRLRARLGARNDRTHRLEMEDEFKRRLRRGNPRKGKRGRKLFYFLEVIRQLFSVPPVAVVGLHKRTLGRVLPRQKAARQGFARDESDIFLLGLGKDIENGPLV